MLNGAGITLTQFLTGLFGSSTITALVGLLAGRRLEAAKIRKEIAGAQSEETKTINELMTAFRETLKIAREAEERHAEAMHKLATTELKLVEAQATLAVRDSVIANLRTDTTSIRRELKTMMQRQGEMLETVDRIESKASG